MTPALGDCRTGPVSQLSADPRSTVQQAATTPEPHNRIRLLRSVCMLMLDLGVARLLPEDTLYGPKFCQ